MVAKQLARANGAACPSPYAAQLPLGLTEPSAPHPDFAARAAIWRDQKAGLISIAEASRRSAAIGTPSAHPAMPTAGTVPGQPRRAAPPRPRQGRSAPNDSRQYAGTMATTAARDDRLTPNAKALLQVLRARCGHGRRTEITKGTMGAVMSRSARTIRRYLADLVRCGYVEIEIRTTGRGLHTGLVVKLLEKVLPFFANWNRLAGWLASTCQPADMPFSIESPGEGRVTLLSSKNDSINESPSDRRFGGRKVENRTTVAAILDSRRTMIRSPG